MKYIAYVAGCFGFLVAGVMILLTVSGRDIRRKEIRNTLPSTVEQTVDNQSVTEKYKVENREEFLADFVENLSCSITSDSVLTIDIMGVDKEKGLLSAELTEVYRHPNGETGTEKAEKTVVLNRVPLQKKTYQISYFLNMEDLAAEKNVYKQYHVTGTEQGIPAPADPEAEGKVFAGWYDEEGQYADFSEAVSGNKKLYAVFTDDLPNISE